MRQVLVFITYGYTYAYTAAIPREALGVALHSNTSSTGHREGQMYSRDTVEPKQYASRFIITTESSRAEPLIRLAIIRWRTSAWNLSLLHI